MEGKAMSEEQVKINEGFVAGVGLGSNTGFGVGRMTQGLVRNHALLDRFEDRRKDIIFDGQAEEQSLTIFPASESAMTIVGAHFIRAGETDRRGHSFCHGMIVDNETFSKEILPYLDTDVFNSQFLTGPQEALGDEGEEVLKFHPVAKEDTDCGEADTGDEEKMKLLYAFALKTVAAEAHYIVQIGSAGRKAFLRTLYELLPPPFRYRMESCSCGEYDQMFNVLIAADQPYTTMERYKTRTLNQILSEDISEEEKRYPNIYMIAADKMMRTGFYDFLEANVPNAECRKDISVQKLQEFLEKKADEYLKQREQAEESEDVCSELGESATTMKDAQLVPKNRKDVLTDSVNRKNVPMNQENSEDGSTAMKRSGRGQTVTDDPIVQVMAAVETILSLKGAQPGQWDELNASLTKLLNVCRKEVYASDYETAFMIMSEEDTILEAKRYLPDRRLQDLVDDYILAGNFGAYLEIRNNILKKGVGDKLRTIQQWRLREVLVMGDTDPAMRSNNSRGWNCYLRLVMLAYQMTQEEYDLYQEKHNTAEILYGPYRYKEIEQFIKENTEHKRKLLVKLGDLCNPFK